MGEKNIIPESFGYNGFGITPSIVKTPADGAATPVWIKNCALYLEYKAGELADTIVT